MTKAPGSTGLDEASLARRRPLAEKHKMLGNLREDEFRDLVIRPLYQRLGMRHCRETCGPDEEGKDCLFLTNDPLGDPMLIAVQTKAGPLGLGAKPSANLETALTQLRTAAATAVVLPDCREKTRPTQVHLCASGKISNNARRHLNEQMQGHAVKVLGADELVALIDKHYPEFWLGVDAQLVPYARRLRKELCDATDTIRISEITGESESDSPVLDGNFVHLRVSVLKDRRITRGRKVVHEPEFVDAAIESLIDSHERLILVTAEGGAGKTTALRRLALKLTERIIHKPDGATVPVLLRAKQLADRPAGLSELAAMSAVAGTSDDPPFTSEDLQQGRVCVLLDALDEVTDRERDGVLTKIVSFHESFPRCQIILTARDYRSILELSQVARFTHYMLMPMSAADAMRLVDRVGSQKAVDKHLLKSTLRKLNDVHGLHLSPMLVTAFLASPDFTKQDLPPNIAEIFKKFTELMLGRWDEKKGMRQSFEANTKDFLLRQLAYKMHVARVRSVPLHEVRSVFSQCLSKRDLDIDPEKIFEEIVYRSGLLRIVDQHVEWRHHLLQEFFAGRGVPDSEFFGGVVSDEWWRAPMVFHFGERGESFEKLRKIVDRCRQLSAADLFNAAISVGLALQACYLAEATQRAELLQWVVESLALSMDAFTSKIDGSEFGGKPTLALCAALALGRDSVGTKTISRLDSQLERTLGGRDALFGPVDAHLAEAWRIIGLLEAGELEGAADAVKQFRPSNPDLVFLVWVSIAWAIHVRSAEGDAARSLQRFMDSRAAVVEVHRESVIRELRSVFFEMKQGKLVPRQAPSDHMLPSP